MKRIRPLFTLLGAGLACGFPALPCHAVTQDAPPVLAQDLGRLRIAGKVGAVLWTVRTDSCTLQVVPPSPGRISDAVSHDPKMSRQAPHVQVWLLKADGSVIAPVAMKSGPGPGTVAARPELTFRFPRSASSEAVAAAMMVDGEYYIDGLKPSAE